MRMLFTLPLAAALAGPAAAQDAYPSRTITLIAPFAAGGSTDLVGRVLSEGLRARLNQTVTVENKPGGTGAIGTREMTKSTPDGYTLLIGSLGAQVLPAAMISNFPVDPLRDLVPIAASAEWVGVMLAKKDLPVATLPEFIAYAKARPGALNFGTSGHGSVVHLIAEVLMRQAGITMQHVPYRGGAQSMTDLLSGSLDVLFTSSPVAVGQAENRNLKMLAVASKTRFANLPNVPTMQEGGVPGVVPTRGRRVGSARPAGADPAEAQRRAHRHRTRSRQSGEAAHHRDRAARNGRRGLRGVLPCRGETVGRVRHGERVGSEMSEWRMANGEWGRGAR